MTNIKSNLGRSLYLFSIQTIVCVFLLSGVALASTGTQTNPASGSGLLLALAIVYFSRKRPIGGWLLYFYIQLYLGTLVSLIFVPQVFSNLNPTHWGNSLLYVMFFLSTVPALVVQFIVLAIATRLLLRRNGENVKYLRHALAALVVASLTALAIDISYFSKDPAMFFDILTLVSGVIWFLYFSKARRVKMVFVDKSWRYKSYSERRALSVEDKKRLRKRALISALITFVLFFLLMGSNLKSEGKPPDIDIFAVPIWLAIVVAVVAWFLPIRKKNKEAVASNIESIASKENDT